MTVGTDALSPLLVHVRFPATKEQIAAAIGDARVPMGQDRTRTVREILERLAPNAFASSRDVERALEQAWPQVADVAGRDGRQRQGDDLTGRPR